MAESTEVSKDKIIYCPHLEKSAPNSRVYETLPMGDRALILLGDRALILCRACYGAIAVTVLDNLKTIKIQGVR